jgi:hypothetical protein
LRDNDLHWLAGLLEGEGSFGFSCTPVIQMAMTDRDIVARAHAVCGPAARLNGPYMPKGGKHPIWRLAVHGRTGAGLMMTLWSLLGTRRREQIRAALARWRESRRPTRVHNGVVPTCHPTRRHHANGLCDPCYFQLHKRTNPDLYARYTRESRARAKERAMRHFDDSGGVLTIA